MSWYMVYCKTGIDWSHGHTIWSMWELHHYMWCILKRGLIGVFRGYSPKHYVIFEQSLTRRGMQEPDLTTPCLLAGHGRHLGWVAHRLDPEGVADDLHIWGAHLLPPLLGVRPDLLNHPAGTVPRGHGGLRRGEDPVSVLQPVSRIASRPCYRLASQQHCLCNLFSLIRII